MSSTKPTELLKKKNKAEIFFISRKQFDFLRLSEILKIQKFVQANENPIFGNM